MQTGKKKLGESIVLKWATMKNRQDEKQKRYPESGTTPLIYTSNRFSIKHRCPLINENILWSHVEHSRFILGGTSKLAVNWLSLQD